MVSVQQESLPIAVVLVLSKFLAIPWLFSFPEKGSKNVYLQCVSVVHAATSVLVAVVALIFAVPVAVVVAEVVAYVVVVGVVVCVVVYVVVVLDSKYPLYFSLLRQSWLTQQLEVV